MNYNGVQRQLKTLSQKTNEIEGLVKSEIQIPVAGRDHLHCRRYAMVGHLLQGVKRHVSFAPQKRLANKPPVVYIPQFAGALDQFPPFGSQHPDRERLSGHNCLWIDW
jgi:hypothetical protein